MMPRSLRSRPSPPPAHMPCRPTEVVLRAVRSRVAAGSMTKQARMHSPHLVAHLVQHLPAAPSSSCTRMARSRPRSGSSPGLRIRSSRCPAGSRVERYSCSSQPVTTTTRLTIVSRVWHRPVSAGVAAVAAVSGCASPPRCPPGASCPAVIAPKVTFIPAVHGQAVVLRKNGHALRYRVRSGEQLAVRITVTVPRHVEVTALWFGISAGAFGNGPKGRPVGMKPILPISPGPCQRVLTSLTCAGVSRNSAPPPACTWLTPGPAVSRPRRSRDRSPRLR